MYTKLSIMAVLLFSLTLISVGCKKSATELPQADQPIAADVVTNYIPDQSNYGTVTQCPVMKEKVVVGKDTKAVKYKDKVYYLCCPSCIQQFKANPEKYR